MKKIVLATIIVILSVSASLSGVVTVRSGEHDTFSRLVVMLEQPSEWSLLRNGAGYELKLKGPSMEFDLMQVFRFIPRLRIMDVDTIEGSTLRISVADGTYATAFELSNGSIVIDVKNGAPPPNSIFESALTDVDNLRSSRKHDSHYGTNLRPLSNWHDALRTRQPMTPKDDVQIATENPNPLRLDPRDVSTEIEFLQQLGRAASQGLIDFDFNAFAKPKNYSMRSPRPRSDLSSDQLPTAGEHLAIRALASIDGDIHGAEQKDLLTENGERCLDESQFNLSNWLKDTTPSDQIASLRRDLLGEFDRPIPEKIRALAKLYVALGFGDEATQLLDTLGASLQDVEALRVMAKIIDERPVDPSSRVRQMTDCDTPVALWAVLANDDLHISSPVNFRAVIRAFSALPPVMRQHLGPQLAERMIAMGSPDTARSIQAAISRAEGDNKAATNLIEARIDMAAGDATIAESRVAPLIAENGPLSIDATLLAVDARLAIGGEVDTQMIANLAALAFEYRTAGDGARIARAHVLAAGSSGKFDEAFEGLERWPETADNVLRRKTTRALFRQMLANPNDKIFMESIFAYQNLLGDGTEDAGLRSDLAERLIGLGFSALARELIGSRPKIPDRDRRILAQASIIDQDGSAALAHILGLSDTKAEEIRGTALSLLGDHVNAKAAFERAGNQIAADKEAWIMGGLDTTSSLDAGTQHGLIGEATPREETKIEPPSDNGLTMAAEDDFDGLLARDHALIRESQDMRSNLKTLLSDRDVKDFQSR